MAVHLPLSAEAQAEARVLMLSSNNVLSPASGRPIVTPSQDMVIGVYYLSELVEDGLGAGRYFADRDEALMAYEIGELFLHAPIKLRLGDLAGDPARHADLKPALGSLLTDEPLDGDALTETTLGRVLLNEAFPDDFPFIDSVVIKSDIRKLIETVIEKYPRSEVALMLDAIKTLGFRFATRAGLTIALDDVRTPADKAQILEEYEKRADKVQTSAVRS
jgi:DNA-directed RNA polymerase subunit beta'